MIRKSSFWSLLILFLIGVGILTWADYEYYRRTRADNRKLYRTVLTLLRIYSLEVGGEQAHADGL